MTIGAKDDYDVQITEVYSGIQTINLSSVFDLDPDRLMKTISLHAQSNKIHLQIKNRINQQRKSDLFVSKR